MTMTPERYDEIKLAAEALKLAREEARAAAKHEKEAKQELKELLEDRIEIPGVVQVKVSTRAGVDRDRLEALYPDVYEDVSTSTEVHTIDILL